MTETQEKIFSLLECLEEEWDLTSEEDTWTKVGATRYRTKAREAKISNLGWEEWMSRTSIRDFQQLNAILSLLVTKGLIEEYEYREEILAIQFPKNFEEKCGAFREMVQEEDVPDKEERKERNKLYFFPESGDAEYDGQTAYFNEGTKGRALLEFFSENPNSPFHTEDIKKHCNPKITNETHYFRDKKDITDTLSLIKGKLRVKKRGYFPIQKRIRKDVSHWILL